MTFYYTTDTYVGAAVLQGFIYRRIAELMKVNTVSFAVTEDRYGEAVDYFRRLTGVEPQEEILEFPKIRVARFKVGDVTLKVMTPSGEGSHISGFLKRHGGGIVSVTLKGLKAGEYDVSLDDGGFLAPPFLEGAILQIEE